ncbi:O-acyltransferase like protein-like [Ctenocephalides felis]|uniref:O-acyltransferase like protein-like n=1 Tax=Ctenocephalides felis TaxID=7515 RepID=UPI000E6E54F4|nr:O-acyltransferase like protein-like [Ctenocephalides felis]
MDNLGSIPEKWLQILPPFDPAASPTVSAKCRSQSKKYLAALQNFEFWALKMHDASGKLSSGILNGNINQFGDFDQCLNIESETKTGQYFDIKTAHEDAIRGKYCLAYLEIKLPQNLLPGNEKLAKLHKLVQSHYAFQSRLEDPGHRVPRFSQTGWALCVPNACTSNDVEASLATSIRPYAENTGLRIRVRVDPEMCQTRNMIDNDREKGEWTRGNILAWIFFAFIISITFVSTVYDLMTENPNELLVSFSLYKNGLQLIATKKPNESSEIHAAHGIRFLNAFMLIISHKSLALFFIPYVNRTAMVEYIGKPWTVIGRAASLYTDPFLMLSGLLTTYALLGRLRRGDKVSILGEYASRLLRIAPGLGALILFCTHVLPYLGSGPQWGLVVTHHADICKKNWWRNMLFIHNYFGFENMCLTHTHHVGIDTQLFFAAVPIIFYLYRWPKGFTTILLTLAIVSTMGRYYVTETRKLSNYIYFGTSVSRLFQTANNMYTLPAHRATVYIIGVLLALVLKMDKPITFTKQQLKIGWTVATSLLLMSFLGPSPMGSLSYKYDPTHAAIYAALAPVAWCAFYAWIILTSHRGYPSVIARIMSWRGFQVATRLSYSIYLTQFPVFFYNVGQTRNAQYYEFFSMMVRAMKYLSIFLMILALKMFYLIIVHELNHVVHYSHITFQFWF